MIHASTLTGKERPFRDDELIVSKTDLKGRITYANDVFLRLAGYSEQQIIGAPHNIIRHPEMPRCVFKLLWDTIEDGREIFAYVINRSSNGDHYWVFAHVTPSYDAAGKIAGFHSNRRVVNRKILTNVIEPLYRDLRTEEGRHDDRKTGMAASHSALVELLNKKGMAYDEWLFSL